MSGGPGGIGGAAAADRRVLRGPGRRALVAVLLASAVGAALTAGGAAPRSRPPRAAAAPGADSVALLEVVRHLADPRLEGRGPGTAGLDSAAAWIARRMASIGLVPGGEGGGWYQPIEVTIGVEVARPCEVVVGSGPAARRYEVGPGMQPLGFSTNGTLRAPVVFAGYGITAPGYDWDDYAGIDARDKIVLVLTNEPGEMDSTSRFDGSVNTPHADLRTKAIVAREHGALAMLVVEGPRHHAGEPLRPPRTDGAGYMTSGLLAARISEEAADRLLRSAGLGLAGAQAAIEEHGRPHSRALPESATVTVALRRTRAEIRNVVGILPGADSARTLVVGAHYDHLGLGGEGSLDPDAGRPHVGADDNASGVAAMLAVAERAAAAARAGRPPRHHLVFCAFTGEEMGLVGSSRWVDAPARPLETIEAMINLDMVGRMRDRRLMVMGAGTAAEFPALLERLAAGAGLALRTSSDGYGPSDHSSFYKKNVPVLMLFTGAHADYHKPSDTWDKIAAGGLARVADFTSALVESLDARPRVTFTRASGDPSIGRIAGGGGYGAYLGSIPDYLQTEGGVLLSGVRRGAPAEQAGLRGGDTIVKFDGVRIDNIYDYTYALRSRKPGQRVRITVRRDGAEVDLLAVLGRRP